MVILTLLVELSASRWNEGTDVDALDYFSNQASSVEDFELSMAFTHEGHRKRNEKSLSRTKRLVALQVYATFAGGTLCLRCCWE